MLEGCVMTFAGKAVYWGMVAAMFAMIVVLGYAIAKIVLSALRSRSRSSLLPMQAEGIEPVAESTYDRR